MKKLAIVLLLLSSDAWAGWKSVGEDDTATSYADPATIVRKGNTATMWSLLDYKAFQRMVEVGYFSQKAQVEYDCAEPRSRGLSLSLHAEKMGEGKVIYEDASPHEWEAVDAGTMSEIFRKVACK
ncbi:MAG: hypothetical protein HY067_05980 [Betaproteobacteria bacterium]|nr:hypothetical protein [Betaproteobacteria bacterium]